MPEFFRDDSNAALVDPSGIMADFASTGIIGTTTTASVQELVLPADFLAAASKSLDGRVLCRLSNGANDSYFALGPSGQSGSYNTANMCLIPQRWIEYMTISPNTVKSIYVMQDSAAGKIQISVLR